MDERQMRVGLLLQDIMVNEEEDILDYYGTAVVIYKNLDKYLDRINSLYDKIFITQKCNDINKTRKLISRLQLGEYEKAKYEALKRNNIELDETLNFRLLNPRYAFLDDILDMIVTDIDVQDQITSLSEEKLTLFRLMYDRLKATTDYVVPYVNVILRRLGYVSLYNSMLNRFHSIDKVIADTTEKLKSGVVLTDKEIDVLLYLCTTRINHVVLTYEDLQRFGEANTADRIKFDEKVNLARIRKDIEEIKRAFLVKAYGIHYDDAIDLCETYNIDGIEITKDNKDIIEMYMAIYQIINEEDYDTLLKLYDEFNKQISPKVDFRRIVVFETELRKAFAKDLNRQLFRTDNREYSEIDGVKVYDAGLDFKMTVTAVGAFQTEYGDKENYHTYWNSPTIRSHGNCCSLIANNNLATAPIRNIVLGFSSMNDNMLLLCGNKDINSTPDSRYFDMTYNSIQKFMSADNLLDNTRDNFNELVYERRDLSSNPKFYKKNPDYIVFIEEFEKIDYWLKNSKDTTYDLEELIQIKNEQERMWKETVKAAKDFGVPIVKINRERVAKSELNQIITLLEEFKVSKKPELISKIITRFGSNMTGNREHSFIKNKYFSRKNIEFMIVAIKAEIDQIKDKDKKNSLYVALHDAIEKEEEILTNNNIYKILTEIEEYLYWGRKGVKIK